MKFQQTPVFGFTTRSNQRVAILQNEIYISEAHDPASGAPAPIKKPFIGIWDTGATGTVICKKISDALGLQPSGRTTVRAVGEGDTAHEYETNTYLVNLYLPNNVVIVGVRVGEGSIAGGDLLLGMDIIGEGDFAISKADGKTVWTFRTPSVETIDFVEQINEYNRRYGPKSPAQVPPLTADEKRKRKNKRKQERQQRRKNR